FNEPAGTYQYSIGSVSGYTASPSSGSVTVSGTTSEAIVFTKVSPTTYPVTFTESGLPSGTTWSVTLNGNTQSSTTSTITFNEPAGTYQYSIGSVSGYTASPSSGSVTVSGTTSEAIAFTQITYPVTFSESGLPSGTTWSVTLNGQTQSSTTSTITFNEPAGTYQYSIGSVSGYTSSPSSGSVTVSGTTSEAIAFTQITYPVTFSESGLP
ncbi:MAG: DUF7619 domain-containing protein, partial [Thermoprotei archaeon]